METISADQFKQRYGQQGLDKFGVGKTISADEFHARYGNNPFHGLPQTSESFPEKVANFTGGKEIAQGIGQAIANPQISKNMRAIQQQSFDIQNKLIQAIKQKKGLGQDTSRLQTALQHLNQDISDTGNNMGGLLNQKNITPEQVGGSALQLGTTVLGAGQIPGLAKTATGATGIIPGMIQGAKTGALTGGIFGASSGVSSAMKQNKSAGDVIGGGLSGGLTGALTGGAVGGVVGGVSGGIRQYQANKANQDFIDKMITPKTSSGKTGLNAIKTGKVKEGTGLMGQRNYSEALPNFDNMKESVSQVPGISSRNSTLQNINAIHDEIGNVANDLKSQLEANKSSFTPREFNKFMNGVKIELADNPSIVGDSEKTAEKILTKFNKLVENNGYTPSGLLESRKQLDQWILGQKGNKVFSPEINNAFSVALRSIRQGGNDFLASRVPDVAVKDLLQHQSNLYNAIDIMAPKAQAEGATMLSRLSATVHKHTLGALAATAASSYVLGGVAGKLFGHSSRSSFGEGE